MSEHVVYSDTTMQACFGAIREARMRNGHVRVVLKEGKRSLPQNSFTHAWYAQLARELREDDELGWKCYCKLHHGVPILRAEDSEFREAYDAAIKGLTYEQKLGAMRILPVTSRMNKSQLSRYAEAIQADFRDKGVMLEFPCAGRWAE